MASRPVRTFRDLIAWQKAVDTAAVVYRATRRFASDDRAPGQQLRRSSASIPANIAEGYGRRTTAEFIHFLTIANGSLLETLSHLELVRRLEMLPRKDLRTMREKLEEVGRLVAGLRRSLRARTAREDP